MEIKVCKNCKRLFKYIYGPELCSDCMPRAAELSEEAGKAERRSLLKPNTLEDEKKLEEVKDYILEHPGATVARIAEVNEVTVTRLLDWVREERLEFSDDSEHAWFQCAKCGIKIKCGIYCSKCKPR
jgi:hypothetical protein